jgi:hypothetical protein
MAQLCLSAALLATAGPACLGCAHQHTDDQAEGRSATPPTSATGREAIDGDWVLVSRAARLRVANGGAIESEAGEYRRHLFGYRLSGAHGPVVELDAAAPDDEYTEIHYPPPMFARRARFLVISNSVGILTRLGRTPSLAFRPGPTPPHLRGRYTLSQAIDGISAIDIGPRAIEFISPKQGEAEALPILAVSEPSGPGAILALGVGENRGQLRIIAAPAGKVLVELETQQAVKGPFDVRFAPAPGSPGSPGAPDAQVGAGAAVLPAAGGYVIEDLSGEGSGRIEIEGSLFRLTAAGKPTSCTVSLVGRLGKTVAHLHLACGPDRRTEHVDLWPLDATERVFLLTTRRLASSTRSNGPYLVYRADAIPSSAPSLGFDKDLDLLCTELGGLETPVREASVTSALQRVGEQASSLIMRSACAGAMQVDPSMRIPLIRMITEQNGRSLPSCPGLERLRPGEPDRGAAGEVTP